MGSISRHGRSERFIEAFQGMFQQSKLRLSEVVSYQVKSQGLYYDSAAEVVRYFVLLAPAEGQDGPEVELFLADWPAVFDPEFYDRDDEIEQMAEELGVDEKLVRAMWDKANL